MYRCKTFLRLGKAGEAMTFAYGNGTCRQAVNIPTSLIQLCSLPRSTLANSLFKLPHHRAAMFDNIDFDQPTLWGKSPTFRIATM